MPLWGHRTWERVADELELEEALEQVETPTPAPAPTAKPRGRFSYDAATRGGRNTGWVRVAGQDANGVVGAAGRTLRERSRDLARNNPIASAAIRVLTAGIVGEGIRPRANTGLGDATDRRIDELWSEWIADASAETNLDFYGLQTLAVRSSLESGEVIIRRRIRRLEDGLPVPLQLQVLEADLLDESKSEDLGARGRIVQGVEYDAIGRLSAYWLRDRHPGDTLGMGKSYESRRVPAAGVAHLFEPLRPGQCRGVPFLAPVMTSIRDIGDYRDAERYRARVAACVVAFVRGNDGAEEGISGEDYEAGLVTDSDGHAIDNLEPGLIAYLRGDKEITFSNPPAAGGNPQFLVSELQQIAAGGGMTYEDLSGDLSKVNFSSYKAGRVVQNRRIRVLQTQLVIPMVCRPVRRWFIDMAITAGLIPARPEVYRTRWIPPAFPEIDRAKEAAADLAELRAGTLDLFEALMRRGVDPEDALRAHKRVRELVETYGLVFDSLPYQTSKAGGMQPGAAPAEPDEPEDEDPEDDESEDAPQAEPEDP